MSNSGGNNTGNTPGFSNLPDPPDYTQAINQFKQLSNLSQDLVNNFKAWGKAQKDAYSDQQRAAQAYKSFYNDSVRSLTQITKEYAKIDKAIKDTELKQQMTLDLLKDEKEIIAQITQLKQSSNKVDQDKAKSLETMVSTYRAANIEAQRHYQVLQDQKKALGDVVEQYGISQQRVQAVAQLQNTLNEATEKYSAELKLANETLGAMGRHLATNIGLASTMDQYIGKAFEGFGKIKEINKDFLQLQYTMSNVGLQNFSGMKDPSAALEASARKYREQSLQIAKTYGMSIEDASRSIANFGTIKPGKGMGPGFQDQAAGVADLANKFRIAQGFSEDFAKTLATRDIQGYGKGLSYVTDTLALSSVAFKNLKMDASSYNALLGDLVDQTSLYNTSTRSLIDTMSGIGQLGLANAGQERATARAFTRGIQGEGAQGLSMLIAGAQMSGMSGQLGLRGNVFAQTSQLSNLMGSDAAAADRIRLASTMQMLGIRRTNFGNESARMEAAGKLQMLGASTGMLTQDQAETFAQMIRQQRGGSIDDILKKVKEGAGDPQKQAVTELKEINKKLDAFRGQGVNYFQQLQQQMTMSAGENGLGPLNSIGHGLMGMPPMVSQMLGPMVAMGGTALGNFGGMANILDFVDRMSGGKIGRGIAGGLGSGAKFFGNKGIGGILGRGLNGASKFLGGSDAFGAEAELLEGGASTFGRLVPLLGTAITLGSAGIHGLGRMNRPGAGFGDFLGGALNSFGIGSAQGGLGGIGLGNVFKGMMAGVGIGGGVGALAGGVGAVPGAIIGGGVGALSGLLGGAIKTRDIVGYGNWMTKNPMNLLSALTPGMGIPQYLSEKMDMGGKALQFGKATAEFFSGDNMKALTQSFSAALSGFLGNLHGVFKPYLTPVKDFATYAQNILSNVVSWVTKQPWFNAGKQVSEGNLGGAVHTIASSYVNPIMSGAGSFLSNIGKGITSFAGSHGLLPRGSDVGISASQLATIPGTGIMMNAKAVSPLEQAIADAKSHGVNIDINSAYRSDAHQLDMIRNPKKYGVTGAIAQPGHSTHNLERGAIGIDIKNYQQAMPFLAKYGFQWANHKGDPWHFDYIGKGGIGGSKGGYNDLIQKYAKANGLDPALVAAVIEQESSFNPRAKSSAGALGLMQLKPIAAKDIGIGGNLFDPATNISAGTKYLKKMIDKYGSIEAGVAHYHTGTGSTITPEGAKYAGEVLAKAQRNQGIMLASGKGSSVAASTGHGATVINYTNNFHLDGTANDEHVKQIEKIANRSARQVASAVAQSKTRKTSLS